MMTTDEMIEHIKTMGDFDEVLLENTGELLGSFKCTQSASNFGTTVNVFAYGEDTARRYSCHVAPSKYELEGHDTTDVSSAISIVHWEQLAERASE